MFEKGKKKRDAFSFSLNGLTTISSFLAAPVVADDRINKIRDAHLRMLEIRRSEAAGSHERPPSGGTELCLQNV